MEMITVSLITGTGSSGTTFLIGLCGELGLCRTEDLYINMNIGGGLESSPVKLKAQDLVYKDPRVFFGQLANTHNELAKYNRKLDFVFVCHRDYRQASLSRIKRKVVFAHWNEMKGYGTTPYEAQIDFFRKGLASTITQALHLGIELQFVNYETLGDPRYCFKILSRRFTELTEEAVETAHAKIWRPDMKHRY